MGPIVSTKVILNPNAGSASAIEALEEGLSELGEVSIARTAAQGDASSLARQAAQEGFETIISAGGDGTLHEVVNGLAGVRNPPRLGVLPLGTGNDFARTLGIPLEPPAALRVLATGRTCEVDVVSLKIGGGECRLINSSAGGFIGVIGDRTDKRSKEWWGSLAYFISAAIELPTMQEYRLRLRFNGVNVIELDAFDIFVGNGRSVGGGVRAAPLARVNDGQMDILVAPVVPLKQLAIWGAKVLAGQHGPGDGLVLRRASRLEVWSEPAMPINADGELKGETPAVYEVLPRSLRMIVGDTDAC